MSGLDIFQVGRVFKCCIHGLKHGIETPSSESRSNFRSLRTIKDFQQYAIMYRPYYQPSSHCQREDFLTSV
ncbi:hypothetical protein KC19_VG105800 [Ceratodon purpureus]|uniref:Uncharacterized protein n=1 Tax=Ceratodon purpureus TaxID=3225 RepID=A0A8T0HP44_CERPU|nr:hypothetical protein KC19_VG105800 [Ceratodon purpureus]